LAGRVVPVVLPLSLAAVVLLASGTFASPSTDKYTSAGIVGLTVTNLGYVGNSFSNPDQPSGEYPLNSNVEHVWLGGIWVGAITADGSIRVSTGAQDAASLLDGDEIREFTDTSDPLDATLVWSNRQNNDNYDPRALATQHIQLAFRDNADIQSGSHVSMGLKVVLRALNWGNPYADDFVILDYAVVNESGTELRDVYLGFWSDTTIGNTENTNPYDPQAPVRWNWYDDVNGAWGPSGAIAEELGLPEGHIPPTSQVTDDPRIWMSYERDGDGDEGLATSWVGVRLLGMRPAAQPAAGVPPVSYNAWGFRRVPAQDTWYRGYDVVGNDTIWNEELSAGKYQLMSNGAFTVGVTPQTDYTIAHDWVSLLSTGPIPYFAPDDTIHVTYAITCGADSLALLANSRVAQVAYDDGFSIPSGPPSPLLEVGYDWNTILLRWAPGDSLDADSGQPLPSDDARRSPEQHVSTITGKLDFQGYRVYRYRGEVIDQDPYALAELVAEYDKVDGVGFDTDLPPLDGQGRRVFALDRDLLDGFPYWYSVISFSAPDLEEGLPSFESGFNENAVLVYPGPSAPTSSSAGRINVVPNPYRGGSLYDNPAEPELGRKIWFTNLPGRCTVKIFTVAGDLVRTLHHDDPADGKHAWDVLSEHNRAIASGLYIYAVENLDTGEIQRGKLVIIK